MTPPLLTLSGPPGGGTTTSATAIATQYNLEHVSGGDIFRAVAKDHGLSLAELTALAEEDDSFDKELDSRLEQTARDHVLGVRECSGAGLILESRLAGWLAGGDADFRVYLDAPADVRVSRIGDRTETADELLTREQSEAKRYMEYHGIDVFDRSIYDLCLNTDVVDEDSMIEILSTCVESLGLTRVNGSQIQ